MNMHLLPAILALSFFSLLGSLTVRGDDDAALDQDIAKMGVALKAQDYPTIIDMMYSPIVKAGGGRDHLIAQTQGAAGQVSFVSMEAIKPYRRITGSANDYVVVPTRAVMIVNGNRYESSSFQLAVRAHGATAWQYVDGAGLTPRSQSMFFADLPANTTFPGHSFKKIDAPEPVSPVPAQNH